MQLKEIVNKLISEKFGSARELAIALRLTEMDVRRLAGMDRSSGRNQEKIFKTTLMLIPLAREIGIDFAEGNPLTDDELLDNIGKLLDRLADQAKRREVKQTSRQVAMILKALSDGADSGYNKKTPPNVSAANESPPQRHTAEILPIDSPRRDATSRRPRKRGRH